MKATILFLGIMLSGGFAMAEGEDCSFGNSGGVSAANTEASSKGICPSGDLQGSRNYSPLAITSLASALAQGDGLEPAKGKAVKSTR